MRYAIVENGIITNMIELKPANEKDFPNAVRADEWEVRIGDTYNAEEERFYHNGEKLLSESEKITQLQEIVAILTGDSSEYQIVEE